MRGKRKRPATLAASGPRDGVLPGGSNAPEVISRPDPGKRKAGRTAVDVTARAQSKPSVLTVAGINPAGIDCYIDTVEAFFRTIPKGVRKEAERLHRKRVHIKPSKNKSGRKWGYRLIVNHQPDSAVLVYLAELEKQRWCVLRRVDVAYDFLAASRQQADEFAEYLRQHLALLWRRQTSFMQTFESTLYFCQIGNSKNLVLYANKLARRQIEPGPAPTLSYVSKTHKV